MDITTSFQLRSASRINYRSIGVALWFAFFMHVLAGLYWYQIENISVAEIPYWENIRLVAGFEQIKSKPEPTRQIKPQQKQTEFTPPASQLTYKSEKKKNSRKKSDTKVTTNKRKVKQTSSANTFVKAVSKPFSLDNPKPVYPSAARRRGMQGTVLLQVKVDSSGSISFVKVIRSSGYRVLDLSAMDSVKKWRFMPAKQDEVNIDSVVQVPVRFILKKSDS